jgi:hypothetical protein
VHLLKYNIQEAGEKDARQASWEAEVSGLAEKTDCSDSCNAYAYPVNFITSAFLV